MSGAVRQLLTAALAAALPASQKPRPARLAPGAAPRHARGAALCAALWPAAWLGAGLGVSAAGMAAPLLAPAGEPVAWVAAPLPAQKLPPTRFEVVELDGQRSLRIVADGSYGNLVHAVPPAGSAARTLRWRWRLDEAIAGASLMTRANDDAAVKVCVLFDLPDERLPFVERQLVRVARLASGQRLPGATVCYVWAPLVAPGQVLPNAHTRRMRWIVLQGQGAPLGQWRAEQRDLHADFLRAFGDEATQVPPLLAVLVGADADNTGGRGRAVLQALELTP